MIYISDSDLKQISIDWFRSIEVIEEAVKCLANNEYSQPVKPYLRYRDLKNRIIAMPAFIGGNINMSGIKWISSFPDNIKKGLPRAHCVVILNNADTGEPVGIINSGIISSIRTASVSGFVIKSYLKKVRSGGLTVGIIGFGPIGRHHLSMCSFILGDQCSKIILYDLNGVDITQIDPAIRDRVEVVDRWEKAYDESDIFITCTVSKERYIDRRPKPRSLHLNVSLRDYKADVYKWFEGALIVDDWEEVCRENTDVELFHLEKGLDRDQVMTIKDLLNRDWGRSFDDGQAIMFNPMGMAIFDIAIAVYYLRRMESENKICVLQ
jgi:2,3-diaminopropionate biosynthesis protein SbnB